MARRGEVLVARRKLGFGAEGRPERFVVVQADPLRELDTVIVAPLDADGALYETDPLVVHVTAREAGTKEPHVVLVHLVAATLRDRFEPTHGGRLSVGSMERVGELLRLALDL